MAKNDKCKNNTRDVEFKINISTEDIDNIVQQIKNIKNDSKSFEELNILDVEDEC